MPLPHDSSVRGKGLALLGSRKRRRVSQIPAQKGQALFVECRFQVPLLAFGPRESWTTASASASKGQQTDSSGGEGDGTSSVGPSH